LCGTDRAVCGAVTRVILCWNIGLTLTCVCVNPKKELLKR